jgi:hypothetical protein
MTLSVRAKGSGDDAFSEGQPADRGGRRILLLLNATDIAPIFKALRQSANAAESEPVVPRAPEETRETGAG